MAEQTQQQVPNRRMRRAIQKQNGMLKILKQLGYNNPAYKAFKRETMEAGRKIHEANVARIEELNSTRLEAVLQNCKSTWFGMGYNQEEVTLLEEAWAMTAVKDKDTYRADKKRARELQREAAALMDARNN
jgi:hypothetical protein